MSQSDPTDNALAAIASILDHKETVASELPEPETGTRVAETVITEIVIAETVVTETVVAETVQPEPDAADRIEHLDHKDHGFVVAEHEAPTTAPEPQTDHVDVDGYTRAGPGPLDAIRFRWTARRDEDGRYYVDETIGPSSRSIESGPMPREDVVHFIDERERVARERFQTLKRDMTLRRAPVEDDTFSDSER